MNASKKFFSLVGGISTHIISGSVFFFLHFYPYRYSYLKRNDPSLTPTSLDYILPMAFGLMFSCFGLGAYIERKTNARVAVFLGDLFVLLAIGLLYFSESVMFDYFIFAFYGVGIGINFLASIKCVLCHFDSNGINGLMSGISLLGFFFSSAFSLLINFWINPENFSTTINYKGDGDYIYPLFITKRLTSFILLYILIIGGLVLLNIFSLCNYKDDNQRPTTNTLLEFKEEEHSLYHLVFCDVKSYMLLLLGLFINFSNFFCLFSYYQYGKFNQVNPLILSYCSFGFLLMCGIGHLIWGILYDIMKFKINMYIIAGSQFLLIIGYYFAVKWSWAYLVIISLIGFTFGGVSVLFPVYLWEHYKNKKGIEAYGFIAVGKAICSFLPMILISILSSSNMSNRSVHLSLMIAGVVCNLISVIIVIFGVDDTPLSYFHKENFLNNK